MMKQPFIVLTSLLLAAGVSCSKHHDNPPPPVDTALLVKEKESFFAPGPGQVKSNLQQFSYDPAGRLVKVAYNVSMQDGTVHPGSYDSLVYQSDKLFERFRFEHDNSPQQFFLDNKLTYLYNNELPVTILGSLYDAGSNTYTLYSKTTIQYDNGKETGQKVYDNQDNLINGYTKTYQGTRMVELVGFNSINMPIYKNLYRYSADTLTDVQEFDLSQGSSFERMNTVYIYNKGKLVKETYTTIPPYNHLMDSTVYRY